MFSCSFISVFTVLASSRTLSSFTRTTELVTLLVFSFSLFPHSYPLPIQQQKWFFSKYSCIVSLPCWKSCFLLELSLNPHSMINYENLRYNSHLVSLKSCCPTCTIASSVCSTCQAFHSPYPNLESSSPVLCT